LSKFTRFILLNICIYILYIIIDKVFTFLDFYSNPQLGHDLMVIPTTGDIWFIVINTLLSFAGSFYILSKIQANIKS